MSETILKLLIEERDKLNRAIEILGSDQPRRGRPPKSLASIASNVTTMPKRRGRPAMTPAEKAIQSKRMKAYWAAKRKAA